MDSSSSPRIFGSVLSVLAVCIREKIHIKLVIAGKINRSRMWLTITPNSRDGHRSQAQQFFKRALQLDWSYHSFHFG
jgi:hypothetical protein